MFCHGRVLPPESRSINGAYEIARLLLVNAGRRLRREEYYAEALWFGLSVRDGSWFRIVKMPTMNDEQAIMTAHRVLWDYVRRELPRNTTIFRDGITLANLSQANARQLDIFNNDDEVRQKWEKANGAMDEIGLYSLRAARLARLRSQMAVFK